MRNGRAQNGCRHSVAVAAGLVPAHCRRELRPRGPRLHRHGENRHSRKRESRPLGRPWVPAFETVDKREETLRRAQGERKKSREIKAPTAQAELVEASSRRKSTVSFAGTTGYQAGAFSKEER